MCNSVLSRKWPHAAGIESLYTGPSWGSEWEQSHCCSPLLLNTLLIKSVTHFNPSSYIAANFSKSEEKKTFKSSVACWAREAGRATKRRMYVLMRHLLRQLRENSGFGFLSRLWERSDTDGGWYGRADHGVGILPNVTSTLLFLHDVYRLCF